MSTSGITRTQRVVSEAGRRILAAAVSSDHDWSLRFSSEDKLIEAMQALSVEDLEAAELLAYHLREAITCNLIRRDMEADRAKRESEGE